MSPQLSFFLVITLAVLLAIVSAIAGALWFRLRSTPLFLSAQLARDLAERQRALEALIARLEARSQPAVNRTSSLPAGPANLPQQPALRVDSPDPRRPSAVTAASAAGLTLIAVPDLSSPASPQNHPQASNDWAQRYGSIWKLADEGVTPDAIARLTGQNVGQVELILGLRRQAASSASLARS